MGYYSESQSHAVSFGYDELHRTSAGAKMIVSSAHNSVRLLSVDNTSCINLAIPECSRYLFGM